MRGQKLVGGGKLECFLFWHVATLVLQRSRGNTSIELLLDVSHVRLFICLSSSSLCMPSLVSRPHFSRPPEKWVRSTAYSVFVQVMGVASNEAEEAGASSLFCVRTHARIGDVL